MKIRPAIALPGLVAATILALALHGAPAQAAAACPKPPAAELAATVQALFAPPQLASSAKGENPSKPPLFATSTVSCCLPWPTCCRKADTADACNNLGGQVMLSQNDCLLNCCT